MEVSQSHLNWVSSSNTLDFNNSTMMSAADGEVAPSGYYQRLLLDEDIFPPQSDGAHVDHVNDLLNLDDVVLQDWEELDWEPSQHPLGDLVEELQGPSPSESDHSIQFPTVDQSRESTETLGEDASGEEYQPADVNGLLNLDDVELLDWEPSQHPPRVLLEEHPLASHTISVQFPTGDQSGESTETLGEDASGEEYQPADVNDLLNLDDVELLDWEPSQHPPRVLLEEHPRASQTIPVQVPTGDQSGESTETLGEDAFGEEYQPAETAECGGECSYDQSDESVSRPALPSGKKIGVTYHRKNEQYEAHLWIKGPQLRGRKKKGVQIFLGNFGTEEEAKRAHDRAAIKLNIQPSARGKPYPLNFPAAVHESFMAEHAHWTARDFLWKIRRTSNKFSKGKSSLKGVTVRKQSVKRGEEWAPKYESKVSLTAKESGDDMKQTFMLGNFKSEEEAGREYDKALLFLHQDLSEVEQLRCITNYMPSSYSAADIQAMASKLSRK